MPIITGSLQLNTRGHTDVHDITTAVRNLLAQTGLKTGVLTIFCPSSTSAVTTLEYEPGCIADLKAFFEAWIPAGYSWEHNASWGDGNGHAHLRAALLGPSLAVPFVGGELTLGVWQQLIFMDFDIRPRQRDLVIQIVGE